MRKGQLGLWSTLALLALGSGCAQSIIVGVDGDGGASASAGAGAGGPSKLTGPQSGMVTVTTPDGVSYEIDSTEVTQAAYAAYLQTNPTPDPLSAKCGWKTTFAPASEPGDANEAEGLTPSECHPSNTHYDPVANPDDPVVCVDWCDAQAYCLWAGKRLCGHVGGGAATDADYGDATTDQWFNACSNGGTTEFPYGSTYVDGKCNDYPAVAAVGSTSGCHGTAAPFDGIFDMSGNVAEWEDNCQDNPFDPDGGISVDLCLLRGGSFETVEPTPGLGSEERAATMNCAAPHTGTTDDSRNFERPKTGFRCCAD